VIADHRNQKKPGTLKNGQKKLNPNYRRVTFPHTGMKAHHIAREW
jgi:hypothetical protein